MRRIKICTLLLLLAAANSHALAASGLTPEELEILARIGADASKRQAALSVLSRRSAASSSRAAVAAADPNRPVLIPAAPTKPTLLPLQSSPPIADYGIVGLLRKNEKEVRQYSGCKGLNFLLRQDWQDIGYVSCPDPVDEATGAQISFTDDRVANNHIWAVHGTAALVYNSLTGNPSDPWTPYDTTVGAYVTVNRAFNSSSANSSADVDKLAYGGVVELGYVTPTGANYFRVRGGGVEERLKGTSNANVTGEFMPVYYPLHVHEPFRPFGIAPFILRYDPVLLAQYAQATGSNQALAFNNRSQALRIGPQVTVHLFPLPGSSDFASRLSGSLTYHWAYEAFSGKGLSWLGTAIKYNIDQAGHLALSFTYQRGTDEDTGVFTNLYKAGLTGKI